MSRRIAPTVDASLRDNPFHPALANHDVMTTQGALPTGRSDNLACYVLPANASKESILDLAYACSLACTSAQAPLAHRKNLFLTCTNIMVPGSIKRLPKGMVKAVKLAPATLTNLRRIFQECNEANKSDDYHIPENALENFTIHKTLPTLQPNIACDNITYCRKKKSLYAHFALVIFQAGKLITDANRSAVTTARPKALIEKYKITGVEILTGAARISNYGHEFIHQAYLEMSAFPGECLGWRK